MHAVTNPMQIIPSNPDLADGLDRQQKTGVGK